MMCPTCGIQLATYVGKTDTGQGEIDVWDECFDCKKVTKRKDRKVEVTFVLALTAWFYVIYRLFTWISSL